MGLKKKVSEINGKFRIRRRIIVFKTILQRGYAWVQLPTLAIIGAGTIKPYFPNISIIWLVVIALSIFLTIGFIDRYAKFLHEEANYGTEMTPLLMKGLRGELKDK